MKTLQIISYLLREMIMEKWVFTVILLLSKTQNIFKEKVIPVMLQQLDGPKMILESYQLEVKINALWFGKCRKWAIFKKL